VFVCFGEKYSAVTYATLIPICVGFGLAAGGDPKFEQTGFILAVTSACCLVAVNTISRRTLSFYRSLVGPLQVQAWATSGSFFLLLAPWLFTGARRHSFATQNCGFGSGRTGKVLIASWLLMMVQVALRGCCLR
jgi:drug/metabolite transporter (DMT)-like permease